jgi:hypothetical protein
MMDEKDLAEQIKVELEERGYDVYLGETQHGMPCIIIHNIVFFYFLKNKINLVRLVSADDLTTSNDVIQYEYCDPAFPENIYADIDSDGH